MNEIDRKNRQNELIALFDKAPIKHIYGMELGFDDEEHAVFNLPYNPHFDHTLGGIHGGVMATLIDNAGWFTVAPHYDNWVATVEFHVRLLEHVERQSLQAIGRLVRRGKLLSIAEMEVRANSGNLVAMGSGTYIVTTIPFQLSGQK